MCLCRTVFGISGRNATVTYCLYDINYGLQVADYRHFLEEVYDLTGERRLVTHYGGEFFCAAQKDALKFVDQCLNVYNDMKEKKKITSFGDGFILSLAAEALGTQVKNAGAYVYRFRTGSFRLVSGCYRYNPVSVLHVPDEKERGMLELYKRFIRKKRIPDKGKVYRILHIKHLSFRTMVKMFLMSIIDRRGQRRDI